MVREELSKSIAAHWNTMFRVALGYVKNSHDAEDIAQNVFMKLYKYEKDFISDEHEKAWLIRVTINEAKNLLGSAWNRNRDVLDENMDESLAAPANDDSEIYRYVRKLKPKYRTVIYLHYYEGYSTKEISSIVKIPQSTVTTQLNRARKLLKENIENENNIEKESDNYGKLQGFI